MKMSLEKACYVLAQAHTRDDDVAGYVVEMVSSGFFSGFSQADYVEAWGVIRGAAHLKTEAAE